MGTVLILALCGLLFSYFVNSLRRSALIARPQPKRSPRNRPSVVLFLACALGLLAVALPLMAWFEMATESNLQSFSGPLVEAPSPGYRGTIHIRLQTDDGVRDIVVQDFDNTDLIMQLRAGDNVTALVHRSLGQYDLWDLRHDQATIQSYQETYARHSQQLENDTTTALWLGLAACMLFVVALALRMHYGVWREPRFSLADVEKAAPSEPTPLTSEALSLNSEALPSGSEALLPTSEPAPSQHPTSYIPIMDAGKELEDWEYLTAKPPIPSFTPAVDQGQARHWSTKQCPHCNSRCYVFDRRCHLCGEKLPSGPFFYWLLAEGVLLAAIVFAYMQAGVWGAGALLVLGFVVERVVKNSAQRNRTAGV